MKRMNDLDILNETLCRGYVEGRADISEAVNSKKIVKFAKEIIEVFDNMCFETHGNDREAFNKCINEMIIIFINCFIKKDSQFIKNCEDLTKDNYSKECKFFENILILREIAESGSEK